MPGTSGGNGGDGVKNISAFEKREKLGVQVRLEADGDTIPRVHQMLEDGTYIPADDSEYARSSAAATAFVTRTLAQRLADSNPNEEGKPAEAANDPESNWAQTAFTSVEGALYEMGRVIAVIEALRGSAAAQPVLELRRTTANAPPALRPGLESTVPASTLREAP